MSWVEIPIPVIRHGQFNGPGAHNHDYPNFVASLSDESTRYPITAEGKVQTDKVLKQIPTYQQTGVIYASQFLRTQETAQIISSRIESETGRGVKIVVTDLLNPIWMPPNSLSVDEYYRLRQTSETAVADEMFLRWADGQIGEPPEMVAARIEKLLTYLKDTSSARPMVITHASLASAMLRHVQGSDLRNPRNPEQILKTAGCYILVVDNNRLGLDTARENFLA
ncbi:hypothetical protein A2Z67_01945 [Candidatus Woesebacteria bacterium RBG_13_36_22]|uniref:Phosphoglycerate mutase n=1 Tax=Candidatus Woesebacteria bacterium RBG_13_36_22 TaxID=1802478 RepID=A0A1F7X6K4_9BACT|nr:MAG: hypothetical protein A2Z67_01945 [Candidatus Woesebacteria bacterium RBG_13_36_22]